jgi:hypothetical protein
VAHGEGVRSLLGIDDRGQQSVLSRHEHGHSNPVQARRREPLPRAVHDRECRRATGRDDQADDDGAARPNAIGQPPPQRDCRRNRPRPP